MAALIVMPTFSSILSVTFYYADNSLRSLQAQFCQPVLDRGLARAADSTLPIACTEPPERDAIVDPMHPLADPNRADVMAAELQYLAAVARVNDLHEQCMQFATGVAPAPAAPFPSVTDLVIPGQ